MAHISGQLRIAAPVEQVFDTVADSRNEPTFKPAATPKGWLRLLGPAFGILGGRFERRIWAGLRGHMATRGGQPPG